MCDKELKSCSIERMSVLDSNNVLYSPFIAADMVDYPITVYVNITHSSERMCLEKNNCTKEFSLLYKLEESSQTNFSQYHPIADVANADIRQVTTTVQFILPQNTSGFYIAAQERSSCVHIQQIKVFYHICVANPDYRGLEIFARVPVPLVNETASVSIINCTGNSSLLSGGMGAAVCGDDGTIVQHTPACRCNDGYYETENGLCIGELIISMP